MEYVIDTPAILKSVVYFEESKSDHIISNKQ